MAVRRWFSKIADSALYVTGEKAQKTFSVLTPYLDLEERLKSKSEVENSIKLRGLALDLTKIEKQWHFYKSIDETRRSLEFSKAEIGVSIANLMKNANENQDKIEQLKLYAKIVKDNLKNVKDYVSDLEGHAAHNALSIPNVLHPKTPNETNVVHIFSHKLPGESPPHLDIAKRNNLIEILNPVCYYLKNEAATFETALVNYFSDFLLENGFVKFSNPDFARSVTVEGCAYDFTDKSQVLTVENKHDEDVSNNTSRLHLVGGCSVTTFMSYFTKNSVQPSYFPLKLYTTGKIYSPPVTTDLSLFNLLQETHVGVFGAANDEYSDSIFKQIVDVFKIGCENLGFHFRVAYLPARELENSESLRASVQMFSYSSGEYVEVGRVSHFDGYLSKRLLFTCHEDGERKFPKVVAGTLCVQKVLACVLERNWLSGEPLLSDLLRKHAP